jgi:serine/threonine protein kinase
MARNYRIGDASVPGYHLVKLLGRGGFGEVWKATAPGRHEVALKIINLTSTHGLKELRAIRLVKQIRHPNLVPIHSIWLKDEAGQFMDDDFLGSALNLGDQELELIIAMGLGDKSLHDRLLECQKEGLPGIPRDELLDYIEQAAQAIDFLNKPCHDLGNELVAIQHCDIKPHNIIIVGDAAQVCDFGLARVLGDSRVTKAQWTTGYVAPEVITANGRPSRWTDQYCLAITYIHLRTGSLPIEGGNLAAMVYAVAQGKLDLSRLPADEQVVLRRATALEPSERFPTTRDMVRALRQAEPVSQPPRPSAPPPTDSNQILFPGSEIVPTYRLIKKPDRDVDQHAPLEAPGPAPYQDENVQFTVFRPKSIEWQKWYPMLAFAHLDELPADAAPDEPDPIEEMKRQAEQVLGKKLDEYRQTTDDSRAAIPREGEITFLPEVPGIEFNPPRRTFLWVESVHREEFRLRASRALVGQTAKGSLSVFLGSILLAEITLSIRVHGVAVAGPRAEPPQRSSTRPYRKIFASYSHKDLPIVAEFERYARALGDTFLRDGTHLRAGEVWSERLEQMIEEADIFQLFWSWNALNSAFVEQEWRYALRLNRPHFIRPTYWEEPLPVSEERGLPPTDLRQLHFQRLTLKVKPQPTCKERSIEREAAPELDREAPPETALLDEGPEPLEALPASDVISAVAPMAPPPTAPVIPPVDAAQAPVRRPAAPRYPSARAGRDRDWEPRLAGKHGMDNLAILLLFLGVLAAAVFVACYLLNLF